MKQSITKNQPLTNSTLIIRQAKLNEVSEIGEIITQSFHPLVGITSWFHPLLKLGVCEDLRSRLRSPTPDYTCLVAIKLSNQAMLQKQDIVGTVEISMRTGYYWYFRKQYTYIANLAVSEKYRRQGVATQLLRKCEQVAYSWGFGEIYLHVLDSNEQAKQLYFNNDYKIKHAESNLFSWIGNNPSRLLLEKKI